MKTKILVLLCGMCAAGLASAECPTSLNKAEHAECMSIESSGSNYQEWKQHQNDMSNESTINPTTGEDVRDIAPAAGSPKSGTMMNEEPGTMMNKESGTMMKD